MPYTTCKHAVPYRAFLYTKVRIISPRVDNTIDNPPTIRVINVFLGKPQIF